jgi:hypothetical protein
LDRWARDRAGVVTLGTAIAELASIKLALTTSSAHWIDRALEWLQSRAVSDDFLLELYNVSKSKTASQQARQRARQLVQRTEQESR